MTVTAGLKPPPKFATNSWAWDYTLAKLAEKDKLTPEGNPQNYAAASAIYKATVNKYGDMDSVPDAMDFELALRSTIIELQSERWTPMRGSAWALDDVATRRLWLTPSFREARHPLNPTGLKVIEPNVHWQAEIARVGEDDPTYAYVEASTALWLTAGSKAEGWVRGEIETALGTLDDELQSIGVSCFEVGGILVDTRFFDLDGTRALMQAAVKQLEEALTDG